VDLSWLYFAMIFPLLFGTILRAGYRAPSWSPEGSYLVFQAQTPDGSTYLFTVLIPTNEFRRLTNSVSYEGEPVWMTK